MIGRNAEKIIFICTHNVARSQMAEGLCRHLLSHLYEAHSAGSSPGERVHPMAVAAMAEIGIDISRQKPKALGDLDLQSFDLAVLVCSDAECPSLPSSINKLSWNIPNPVDMQTLTPEDHLRKFRKVRDDIKKLIQGLNRIQSW